MTSLRVSVLFMGLCLGSFCVVNCIRTPTHKANAFCIRDPDQNTLTMTMAIDMMNDYVGDWRGLTANNQVVATCTIDPTADVSLRSVVNTNDGSENTNGCGFNVDNSGSTTSYIWRIQYREGPDSGTENFNIDAGKNRIYRIDCPADSPTNQIEATIQVTADNLDQTIIPQVPEKKLEVVYAGAGLGLGAVVGTEAVAVGRGLRLRATVNVAALTSPKARGFYARETRASSSSNFNVDIRNMLNTQGCTINNNIYSPGDNYKYVASLSSANVFVHETGVFNAWLYENSNFIHIRTKIGYCYTQGETGCVDSCVTLKRRRRDVTDEKKDDVAVTLRIYDPNKESESSTGLYKDVLIGVCVAGGVVLALLVVATCCIVTRIRRRREKKHKVPAEGFENKVQIRY